MQTADLFGNQPITRAAARQRAAADACARADMGMQRSEARNEAVNAGWCGMALHALRQFARGQIGMWTIEQARSALEGTAELPRPTDGRAWGAVVVRAIEHGYIVKTKQTAPAASSNGAPKPLFTRGPNAS